MAYWLAGAEAMAAMYGIDIEEVSAAAPPPAAEAPVAAPDARVVPEAAVEDRPACPPASPPAEAPKPPAFHSQCKRCREYHQRMGDLCAACVADDRDINGLHGAYFELRQLLAYAEILNDCPEGMVRLALVISSVHDTLIYGRKLEALRVVHDSP